MSARDPELDRLLAGEIERRLTVLVTPTTGDMDVRAALHSLKGSAGMARPTMVPAVSTRCWNT